MTIQKLAVIAAIGALGLPGTAALTIAQDGPIPIYPRRPAPATPPSPFTAPPGLPPSTDATPAGDWVPDGAVPYLPPRVIHYGWPALRVYRRDLPFPKLKFDPKLHASRDIHPRQARLEIKVVSPARIYVDGEELDPVDGKYRLEPELPLWPGVPYMHSVRVESVDESGQEIARTVTVYLRMGRVTELTFY